jgi:hypothetical protein
LSLLVTGEFPQVIDDYPLLSPVQSWVRETVNGAVNKPISKFISV